MTYFSRAGLSRAEGSLRRPGTVCFAFSVMAIFFLPHSALATQKVYSPIVEEGEFAIEYRGHHDFDSDAEKDGGRKMKVELEYGATDFWSTALEVEFERENKDDATFHSATAWENRFQFTPQGKYWLDSGLFVEIEKPTSSGSPDKVEIKILLEKGVGSWLHTANVNFEKQFNDNAESGVEYGYSWRSKYAFSPRFELGLEAFGTLGKLDHTESFEEQSHQAGPVISGVFPVGSKGDKIKYELGYLVGLTRPTVDGSLKWLLEYETHF